MRVTEQEISEIIDLGEDCLVDILGDYDAIPTFDEYDLVDNYFSANHQQIYGQILNYRRGRSYRIGIETELEEILPVNTTDGFNEYLKYCVDVFNITPRLQNAFHAALQDVKNNNEDDE